VAQPEKKITRAKAGENQENTQRRRATLLSRRVWGYAPSGN